MSNIRDTVYCHFSFRRPKGAEYGLFSAAIYLEEEGKTLIARATRKLELWENQQFVTAIQAYENALFSIHNWQGKLKRYGIKYVALVTDNATLAGWISYPRKNKEYYAYMKRANLPYQKGGGRELSLEIGICDVMPYEKSYKFCTEANVCNTYTPAKERQKATTTKVELQGEYKSVIDIINDDKDIPVIEGKIEEL